MIRPSLGERPAGAIASARRQALVERLDTPAAPMLVAGASATAFVLARWLVAAHRNLGRFIVVGSRYSDAHRRASLPPVTKGSGYDGQFYYRLALDPFDLRRTAYGIRLDSISRTERIGYPFLSWLVSLGHHGAVPLAMVIVNVLACSVLALAGGLMAKSVERHALYGLALAGYWGYLWTIGRDLVELTAAAFLILGFAALLRRRPTWAGLAFVGAVLSKETAVLMVGVLALTTLAMRMARQRCRWDRPLLSTAGNVATSPAPAALTLSRALVGPANIAFVLPLGAFVGWQVVLVLATHHLPIYKSGGENLALPFVGLAHGISHYLSLFPSVSSALWFGELALLVVLSVSAAASVRACPVELRPAWVVALALAACTAVGIWLGDVGFRSLDLVYLMGWTVLLFRKGTLLPWLVLCGGAWIVVAVELVRFI
ncbi:MAG TPA: hypothetical protein VL961_00495 [Acidimicrobiales bacterium]|nr:hypothetical protein [Acidimicrobiales bacterium]